MFYNALGRLTWFSIKLFLRRRYGPTMMPKPVLAGAVVTVGVGAAYVAQRAQDGA